MASLELKCPDLVTAYERAMMGIAQEEKNRDRYINLFRNERDKVETLTQEIQLLWQQSWTQVPWKLRLVNAAGPAESSDSVSEWLGCVDNEVLAHEQAVQAVSHSPSGDLRRKGSCNFRSKRPTIEIDVLPNHDLWKETTAAPEKKTGALEKEASSLHKEVISLALERTDLQKDYEQQRRKTIYEKRNGDHYLNLPEKEREKVKALTQQLRQQSLAQTHLVMNTTHADERGYSQGTFTASSTSGTNRPSYLRGVAGREALVHELPATRSHARLPSRREETRRASEQVFQVQEIETPHQFPEVDSRSTWLGEIDESQITARETAYGTAELDGRSSVSPTPDLAERDSIPRISVRYAIPTNGERVRGRDVVSTLTIHISDV